MDRGARSWYAKCPAHDDKSPSLSIRETGDTILIHCFAGCSAEDVLAAVGLSFRDLYRDEWQAARRAATATAAHDYQKRLRDDPQEHERLILEIAQADIDAGKTLSIEDRARIELALQRMRGAA
jgi:DNA primase